MTQELIVLENLTAVDVYQKENGVSAILARIEDDVKKNLVDVSTEDGREACRSFAYKIARSKTALATLGIDEKLAHKIITMIEENRIPNLTINY